MGFPVTWRPNGLKEELVKAVCDGLGLKYGRAKDTFSNNQRRQATRTQNAPNDPPRAPKASTPTHALKQAFPPSYRLESCLTYQHVPKGHRRTIFFLRLSQNVIRDAMLRAHSLGDEGRKCRRLYICLLGGKGQHKSCATSAVATSTFRGETVTLSPVSLV